jgi:DNA polymerase elongation subunit (family B)
MGEREFKKGKKIKMFNFPVQNISSLGSEIILFNRQQDGKLSQFRDKNFMSYYYTPSPTGIFRGYFGGKFNKVFCKNPWEIRDKRDVKVDGESDIIYTRRYLLDKVNIIKSRTRWIMFDIETKSKIIPNPFYAPDPITCITAYDNYINEYKTFFLGDITKEHLTMEEEKQLINDFIDYIKICSPDLLIAYNSEQFDAPYLINRFPNFAESISPINRIKKRNGYPEGISIVDYYKLVKKVYKYKRHTLDYIYSEEFKEPQDLKKYRFDIISEEIKNKNIRDVKKMVRLENERFHLVDYFDEIRRTAKVLWEDLCNYSISIDGLILQNAKIKGVVLPSKPDEIEKLRRKEEDEIIGGYVYAKIGRYDGVTLLDVSGTYPNLIVTFNLDPVNKRKEPNEQTIPIRKVHILQNPNAIVPTVSNRLINSRKQIQKELETKTGSEYDLLKKQDEAHKSLNNTLYGILLFKNSRIYDKDIADTITYLARFLIRYTKYALRLNGYEVIACDTDSVFIHSLEYEKIIKLCNEIIVPRWLLHLGKNEGNIKFKYEGYFKNIVFEAPKHYKGNFITAKGEEKVIDKGIEIVRRDSSKFQEDFLEELYNKILKNEFEQDIANWILNQIKELPNKPLKEIAFPFQINQNVYNSIPIFMRALQYTDEIIPNFSKDYHNELYYIYVTPFGKAERNSRSMRKNKDTGKKELKESHTIIEKNVICFDENTVHIKEVDYKEMIRRNILEKAENLWDALGWNKELIGIMPKVKKERKKKINKQEESIIKSQPTYTESDFLEENNG